MSSKKAVSALWTAAERKVFAPLKSPLDIQGFLNSVPYSSDKFSRSPRSVIRDRRAHCYDGALFAAAALRQIGERPLLLDLRAAKNLDDDHVLAVFQRHGCWGSIGKSNFVGLRYREPIHRSVRELVMSYFNDYFNSRGDKTLRSYSVPFDLSRHDDLEWMTCDGRLEEVAAHLDRARHVPVIDERQARELSLMDERALKAGLVGSVKSGLFKVE